MINPEYNCNREVNPPIHEEAPYIANLLKLGVKEVNPYIRHPLFEEGEDGSVTETNVGPGYTSTTYLPHGFDNLSAGQMTIKPDSVNILDAVNYISKPYFARLNFFIDTRVWNSQKHSSSLIEAGVFINNNSNKQFIPSRENLVDHFYARTPNLAENCGENAISFSWGMSNGNLRFAENVEVNGVPFVTARPSN